MECVADDGVVLAGTLSAPDGDGPWPCVVALHTASGGDRAEPIYGHLVETAVPRGVAVLRYDRRGTGSSRGHDGSSLERLTRDAGSFVRLMVARPEIDGRRVGVWGVSQGGWLGPMTAVEEPSVAFVVAVSAPGVSPSQQMHFAMENVLREQGFDDLAVAAAHRARSEIEERYLAGDLEGARAARLAVGPQPWAGFAYLPEIEDLTDEPFGIDLDPLEVWGRLRVPTLAVYGEWDRWVPIGPSTDAWRAAFREHPELLTVERVPLVGHMMTVPDDPHDLSEAGTISPVYTRVLAQWLAAHAV